MQPQGDGLHVVGKKPPPSLPVRQTCCKQMPGESSSVPEPPPNAICGRLYQLQIIDSVKFPSTFFGCFTNGWGWVGGKGGGGRLHSSTATKNDTITAIKGISDYQFHPSADLEFSTPNSREKKHRCEL